MTSTAQPIEWYLARDNKQHGPLSDVEFMKLVEFRYLKEQDLVWRIGFSDWTPAPVAFPHAFQRPAASAPAADPGPQRPRAQAADSPAQPAPSASVRPVEPQPTPPFGERGAGAAQVGTPSPIRAKSSERAEPAAAPAPGAPETLRARLSPSAPGAAASGTPAAGGQSMWIGADAAGSPTVAQQSHQRAPAPATSPRTSSARFDHALGPLEHAPPAGRQRTAQSRHSEMSDDFARGPIEPIQRPRRLHKLVALIVIVALAGTAAWAIVTQPQIISEALNKLGVSGERIALATQELVSSNRADGATATALREQAGAPAKPMPVANLQGFPDGAPAIDEMLQAGHLWKIVRAEFPEWYGERVREAARLVAEKKPDEAVTKHLIEALISLRRKNAEHALQSSLPRLQQVARTFRDSLEQLARFNHIACYALISSGEGSRGMITLFRDPQHTAVLQNGLATIFESIAEGRRTPQTNLAPRRSDYDVLTQELNVLGWKEAELALFADAQELAKSPPEQVCRMVREWFTAHLAIRDKLIQQRLLVESVRPVISG